MPRRLRLGHRLFQYLAVAGLGHPPRAGKVALPAETRAIPFSPGITMQHDTSRLCPVGSIHLSIEQSQIRDEVSFVVDRDLRLAGSEIVDIGSSSGRIRIGRPSFRQCSALAAGWNSSFGRADL